MRSREQAERSQDQPSRSTHTVMQTSVATAAANVLALQRSAGNHATSQLLQRTLDPSLKGRDVDRRLQNILAKPGKGRFGKGAEPDTSIYDAIVASETSYTWELIQADHGPFTENVGNFTHDGTEQITLYRADNRTPPKLKGSNPPGFGTRTVTPFSLLKADLLKDPAAFAEDQVRNNRQDLKSYATDTQAGGYAAADRTLYRIDLGNWTKFKHPKNPVIILANSNDLATATRIAINTGKSTHEIFLLFEVGLTDITEAQTPGNAMAPIDWNTVVAEAPGR